MIHTRRYINKAKYAPKTTDSLKPLDVAEILKKEIDCGKQVLIDLIEEYNWQLEETDE